MSRRVQLWGVCFAVVAMGASFFWARRAWLEANQAKQALTTAREEWDRERASWPTHQPSIAPTTPAPPRPATPTSGSTLDPRELLRQLAAVRPVSGPERSARLRDVVYYLEALERVGEPAVPVVSEFLQRFEDVPYDPDAIPPEETDTPSGTPTPARAETDSPRERQRALMQQLGRALQGRRGSRPLPQMNYDFPPTLRLGLLDTLHDIGTESAQQALGEVLQRSGRAIEVAYAAKQLKSLSGDRWRDPALQTAHELLLQPTAATEGGAAARIDRRAEEYLYAVLALFQDQDFAATASQRLIRDDGSIDRGSLNYLTRTLQQNALPTLAAAFNDPRITNLATKAVLLQQALPYVGADPAANAMFAQVVTNPELPPPARMIALEALTRGSEEEGEVDPALLQQRYDLLQTLKPQLEAGAFRRINATLSRQLGLPVAAGEEPKARPRRPPAP